MNGYIADIIVVMILLAAFCAAVVYIYKEKKRGRQCLGCPMAGECTKRSKKKNGSGKKGVYRCGLLFLMTAFFLTGCGHVKSAKALRKMAKRNHGACEVVSTQESEEKTVVVLKDKLQGFEYKMVSKMNDLNIDGSSFGSLPSTSDGFDDALNTFAISKVKDKLTDIGEKYGAVYEERGGEVLVLYTLEKDESDLTAAKIVEEASAAFQEINLKNRMDKKQVVVEHDQKWLDEKLGSNTGFDGMDKEALYSGSGASVGRHIGSARLPDCRFRGREEEMTDSIIDMAKMRNRRAEFLRKEQKTLGDSGAPLYCVQAEFGYKAPADSNDPVMFYYFTLNDKEFFFCDFIDKTTGTWYTNYDKVITAKDEKEARKKDGWLHIHFNIS